ncbi:glutamine synthetase family protein [Oscillospiraceae bacterium MB08-C2-2]|nr:glutamine synthetase family protein [Oscillospiraceae bacterium MB08-C2-2]
MAFTVSEVLEFVQENDVKFIRLAFCNLFGVQKNISIMAGELPDAFERGVCIDTASVEGLVGEEDGDIFLFPDPATLSILPWRPSHGRVVRFFCEIRRADGSPSEEDGRKLLQNAVQKATDLGYTCQIGCECEFYLFELDETGVPSKKPQDTAGYCDIAPLDKGENVRREICMSLEDMGIQPESSHHERGPGQNEIVCKYSGPLQAADALISFRAVSSVIAARNGLHASFLPKPLADKEGNALHINLSLSRGGVNLFKAGGEHSHEAESFLAGVLAHLDELTLFLNPLASSYCRFGDDVPRRLTWSHQNRAQLVRIPAASGQYSRMELRSPDPSLNPYLAFALLMEAGLEGIQQGRPLSRSIPEEDCPLLPSNLEEAIKLAQQSALVAKVIPQKALEKYIAEKHAEHELWQKQLSRAAVQPL